MPDVDVLARLADLAKLARPELGEAMTGRVLASGGSVGLVDRHAGLGPQDGVGAILRYAA